MENLPTSFRAPLTGAAGNTAVVGWHPELAIAVHPRLLSNDLNAYE